MYVGRYFLPADQSESEVYSFDFVNDLATGETVTAVTAFTIELVAGTDADPNSRKVGSAQLISARIAAQRLAGLRQGATYKLQAVVTTSNANTLSLWSFVECKGE
jgi:hypothetical protein